MFNQTMYSSGSRARFTPNRERSGCLWILLILGTVGGIVSMFRGCSMPDKDSMAMLSAFYGETPDWYWYVNGFSQFLGLICIFGIWFWKKWGWYGIIVINVVGILVAMAANFLIGYTILGAIIGLAIWWAVLSGHWHNFE